MSLSSILSNSTSTSTSTTTSGVDNSTSTSSFYSTAYASLTSSTSSTSSLTAVTSSSAEDEATKAEKALQDLTDQIGDLIDDVTSETGETSVSFRDIIKYRDQLQEDFEKDMDKALSKLGLDMSTEFTLSWDADKDKVTVNSADGSIDLVADYFRDNEDMRKAFATVLSYNEMLGDYEDDLDFEALRARVLPDKLSEWLASQRETTDQLGQSGSMLFGEGDDSATYIKVDVTV
ncbi:MAG: hypothetical protein AB7D57_01175 [Desulfovibrionaceae bacterium]